MQTFMSRVKPTHGGSPPVVAQAKSKALPRLDEMVPAHQPGWAPRSGRTSCLPPRHHAADPVASRKYDGYIVGAGGRMIEPDAPLGDASTVEPRTGASKGVAIFVNGILNNLGDQTRALQGVADATGYSVVGVHNATGGAVSDLAESIGQKLGLDQQRCVDTTARLVLDELAGDRSVRLFGHSQGGLVLSLALAKVKSQLESRGFSPGQVKAQLARIEVTALGSAASSYPEGPKYTLVDNELDPISRIATAVGRKLTNAKQVWFRDEAREAGGGPIAPHLLTTYLKKLSGSV